MHFNIRKTRTCIYTVRYLLLTNDIFQTTNSCVPLLQFKTGFQLIHKIYAQGNLDYK